MDKNIIKLIVFVSTFIIYIIFVKFVSGFGNEYIGGPLLVLADSPVGIGVLVVNAIVYISPVVWLISLMIFINKTEKSSPTIYKIILILGALLLIFVMVNYFINVRTY